MGFEISLAEKPDFSPYIGFSLTLPSKKALISGSRAPYSLSSQIVSAFIHTAPEVARTACWLPSSLNSSYSHECLPLYCHSLSFKRGFDD